MIVRLILYLLYHKWDPTYKTMWRGTPMVLYAGIFIWLFLAFFLFCGMLADWFWGSLIYIVLFPVGLIAWIFYTRHRLQKNPPHYEDNESKDPPRFYNGL